MSYIKKDGECAEQGCFGRHRHRKGEGGRHRDYNLEQAGDSLLDCREGNKCLILWNPNRKTREIGMNPGKTIVVFKNQSSDSNMIICLEATRYIIAKSIAEEIRVEPVSVEEQECRKTS